VGESRIGEGDLKMAKKKKKPGFSLDEHLAAGRLLHFIRDKVNTVNFEIFLVAVRYGEVSCCAALHY